MPSWAEALELLPGWYDDWVLLEREPLRQRVLHGLEALSRHLVRAGRFAEAVEAAMVAVAVEPLRESAQRALVTAHLAEAIGWRVAGASRPTGRSSGAISGPSRRRTSPRWCIPDRSGCARRERGGRGPARWSPADCPPRGTRPTKPYVSGARPPEASGPPQRYQPARPALRHPGGCCPQHRGAEGDASWISDQRAWLCSGGSG
jgi:hypothetical protein